MTRRRPIFAAASQAWKIILMLFCLCFCPGLFAATEIRDTEIETAVRGAIKPLADAADIPAERLKIRIIGDSAFNAFVAGGTDIFINTGLLIKIDSFAQLQAVVAHEIGHAMLGHIVQMQAKIRAETARTIAMQALGIGLIALNPGAAIGVMAASGGMAGASMLAFTRDEERAADDYAVKLMRRADIDPAALIEVFQKMQTMNSQSNVNPNDISHPLTDERIRNLKVHSPQSTVSSQQSKGSRDLADQRLRTADLKLIQAKLIGYLEPSRVKTLYPDSDKSDPALYARAIARMRGGDFGLAKTGTMTLISRHGKNPYFYELLGDIEFQSGNYGGSADAYEKSLKNLAGGKNQIEVALALALTGRNEPGDRARAAELCRRALLADPVPLAYWVLARADPAAADYYLAEYHYLSGDLMRAKQHASAALKKLKSDSPEYLKARDIAEAK
jgi:predicted Zn-dependent protease